MTSLFQYRLEVEDAKLFLPNNFLNLEAEALVAHSKVFDDYPECEYNLMRLINELIGRLPADKKRKNVQVFKIVNPAIAASEPSFDAEDLEWTDQLITILIAVDKAAFKKGELIKLFEAFMATDVGLEELTSEQIELINA